ncbi:MAG: hypothetical protein NE330_12160 [Lentisphaeraceae bacterium]|nr:hypothetical protein [Lentisphaeraceae bacterium]
MLDPVTLTLAAQLVMTIKEWVSEKEKQSDGEETNLHDYLISHKLGLLTDNSFASATMLEDIFDMIQSMESKISSQNLRSDVKVEILHQYVNSNIAPLLDSNILCDQQKWILVCTPSIGGACYYMDNDPQVIIEPEFIEEDLCGLDKHGLIALKKDSVVLPTRKGCRLAKNGFTFTSSKYDEISKSTLFAKSNNLSIMKVFNNFEDEPLVEANLRKKIEEQKEWGTIYTKLNDSYISISSENSSEEYCINI